MKSEPLRQSEMSITSIISEMSKTEITFLVLGIISFLVFVAIGIVLLINGGVGSSVFLSLSQNSIIGILIALSTIALASLSITLCLAMKRNSHAHGLKVRKELSISISQKQEQMKSLKLERARLVEVAQLDEQSQDVPRSDTKKAVIAVLEFVLRRFAQNLETDKGRLLKATNLAALGLQVDILAAKIRDSLASNMHSLDDHEEMKVLRQQINSLQRSLDIDAVHSTLNQEKLALEQELQAVEQDAICQEHTQEQIIQGVTRLSLETRLKYIQQQINDFEEALKVVDLRNKIGKVNALMHKQQNATVTDSKMLEDLQVSQDVLYKAYVDLQHLLVDISNKHISEITVQILDEGQFVKAVESRLLANRLAVEAVDSQLYVLQQTIKTEEQALIQVSLEQIL